MLLVLEIGMLIMGLYALIAGKFTLTKTRVVRGGAARCLGAIAMLPLPLAIGVVVLIGVSYAASGRPFRENEWRLTISLIEAGLLIACLAAVYLIGWPLARSPEVDDDDARGRHRDRRDRDRPDRDRRSRDDDRDDRDWDDDDDDRHGRRRRRPEAEPIEAVALPPPIPVALAPALPAASPIAAALPPALPEALPLPAPGAPAALPAARPLPAPAAPPIPAAPTPTAPAPLRFRCAGCTSLIQISATFAGQNVRCPQCQAVVKAPAASPAPVVVAPALAHNITAAAPPPAVVTPAPAQHITERPPAERISPPPVRRADSDRDPPAERRRPAPDARPLRRPSSFPVGLIVALALVGVLVAGSILGLVLWKIYAPVPAMPVMVGVEQEVGGLGPVAVKHEKIPAGVLPPLPDPVDIKPAPIQAETPVKLPAPIGALRVGGGGRFLLLHFPSIRQIGVFDANEAKVMYYISPVEPDHLFAAGMTKLVVFAPATREVRRFNLLGGARDKDAQLNHVPDGEIEAFCMGHASSGPLLVSVANKGAKLYDIEQFQEIPTPPLDAAINMEVRPGARLLDDGKYWAGASGRIFGHTGNRGMPNGVKSVIFTGNGLQKFGEHRGTWFVMPGPDDRHIYSGGYGVVSDRIRPVTGVAFSMGPGQGVANHLYLPAHHGPYYLHAQTIDDFAGDGTQPPVGTVRIFVLGDKEPIATYKNTAVCRYGWEGLKGVGIEHSLHLIPKAKLFVIVPESRDELRLYPADLEAALDNSGRDFLVFTSTPPASFQRGQPFAYQANVRARKVPVTFRLDSAPEGMTVDAKGLIQWTPPANFAAARVDVILAARDSGGQQMFQNLSLTAR